MLLVELTGSEEMVVPGKRLVTLGKHTDSELEPLAEHIVAEELLAERTAVELELDRNTELLDLHQYQ